MRSITRVWRLGTLLALLVMLLAPSVASADPPANDWFSRTWARTDKPVADQEAARTWMWGPEAFTADMFEEYAEGHNGARTVQYFDKSRMEISTDPNVDPESIWFVTNGLLAKELITGQMQVGNNLFRDRTPYWGTIAGDADDVFGPRYAHLTQYLDDAPYEDGQVITTFIHNSGDITNSPSKAEYGVTAAYRLQVPSIDHQVASVFWEFMNSSGTVWEDGGYDQDKLFVDPFYATGFPITEAYWASVTVAGDLKDVLIQCFERRCLTYTPDNPEGWKVEAGNVGQHYYRWRHEEWAGDPPALDDEVYASDLRDWPDEDFGADGEGFVENLTYHLRAAEYFGTIWLTTDEGEIQNNPDDFSVSVDVRATEDRLGEGCLVVVADEEDYVLIEWCIGFDGKLRGYYETMNLAGQSHIREYLTNYISTPSANPATEWNTMRLTVKDQTVWLYVNDDMVAVAEIPEGVIPQAGILVFNAHLTDAVEYEFTNLEVYDLSEAAG
jgi:hypothetical protein